MTRARRLTGYLRRSDSADDDLADLNHRSEVGVIGDVAHDFLGVRTEATLKGLHRVAENVAHANMGARRPRSAARQPLVDRVVLAAVAHAGLYQRHVLVTVVLVIESSSGRVGIHHTDFDHLWTPG